MIKDEDPRFRNLERKIGLFILTALAGIVLMLIVLGMQRNLFSHTYNLHFTVDRGTGFSKGMQVKLSGFRIGRITDLTLNDQAMVDISIEVDKKYSKWIRSDTTAKLVKEGLVGDSIVELAVGSLEKAELKNGESVIYVKTKALDEIVDEVAEKVKPVLIEVRDIIGYINDPNGDLKKTVHNLEILTRNLEQTRTNTDNLIATINRNVETNGQRTASLLDSATRKIESLDVARLNTSLDMLPPLLAKTDAAMANINVLSADTKKLAQKTFPIVPNLLTRTEDLLFSTDRLLNSLRSSWLLGGSAVSGPSKRFRAGDSHD